MEPLSKLAAGPGPTPSARDGIPIRISAPANPAAGAPAQPFAAALFEAGARPGAAPDSAPPEVSREPFAVPSDRRGFSDKDEVPERDFSLGDLLDVINPLQHIPIVANIYRALTGDTISGPARVAGGALYGGPLGMVAGAVSAIVAELNGADPGDTLVAGLLGQTPPSDIQLAGADPAPAPAQEAAGAAAPVLAVSREAMPDSLPLASAAFTSGFRPEAGRAPALAASFVPQAPARVLTGDAALSALFGDFQARGAAFAAPSSPEAPAEVEARAVPASGFSGQMAEGLAKYRAMAIARGGAGRPAPERLDRQL